MFTYENWRLIVAKEVIQDVESFGIIIRFFWAKQDVSLDFMGIFSNMQRYILMIVLRLARLPWQLA